jgi:DNA-binding MarR family transcriptional regulator
MAASQTSPNARARPASERAEPEQLDEDTKRLMAAILDFTSLQRQRETSETASQLQIGGRMQKHALAARHSSALLTVALYGPMTVTQLAERQRVKLKAASLTAVELEKAGLLERREDPADRRRTILTIPRTKEHVISQGLLTRAEHLERALDHLTTSERRGLIKGLEALTEEMARQPSSK